MYHGKKRETEKVEITPEEKAKQEALANKITNMLNEFLEIRHGEKEVQDPIEFCNIMVQLCPEIPHVYNFRREILLKQIKEQNDLKASYKMICEEIMMTMSLLKKRPKCYSIWSHRQWLVLKAFDLENQIIELTKQPISPRIVEQDLMICSKMLKMDERNFHAWNYRIWLVRDVLKYNKDLVVKELEYLKQKIEDNFSNFSAFHFRGKHLTVQHLQNIKQDNLDDEKKNQLFNYYFENQEIFEEELEMVKNAIFIEPNEQGVWQQYKWLISLQIPFTITKAEKIEDKCQIKLVASQKVSSFLNNIKISDENIKLLSLQPLNSENSDYDSYEWVLTYELIDSEKQLEDFILTISENTIIDKDFCQENNLKKHNLIGVSFQFENNNKNGIYNKQQVKDNEMIQRFDDLFTQEFEFLNEVIESEPKNTFSEYHKIFMYKTDIYMNFLKNGEIQDEQVQTVKNIQQSNDKLKQISKKQINFLNVQDQKFKFLEKIFTEKKYQIQEKQNFEILEFTPYLKAIDQL